MLEWVESEGARLAVEVVGEGEPVSVVAHGITQSRRELSVMAPFIPGTTVLFDFRGHGESERPPPGSYSMDHFAADVDSVATAYGATALIGASLGGGAALRLLTRDPGRFEKLVILLPAWLEADAASRVARMRLLRVADLLERYPLDEAAERILQAEEAEGAFDGYPSARRTRRDSLLRMNREGTPRAIREVIDDPPIRDPEPITRVPAPALVIGQEGDPVHRASVARELAAALPKAELIMLPDPHAMMERIPELVARVGAFLTSSSALEVQAAARVLTVGGHRMDLPLTHQQEVLAADLHLDARVGEQQDLVPRLHVLRVGARGHHLDPDALLVDRGGRSGDQQAALGAALLFVRRGTDEDAVVHHPDGLEVVRGRARAVGDGPNRLVGHGLRIRREDHAGRSPG